MKESPIKKHEFKKGQSGNPNGRPLGALSQVTKDVRYVLAEAAKQNLPKVTKALEKLLDSDDPFIMQRGAELYIRMLEFSVPKLQANKIETDAGSTAVIVIGKPAELDIPFNSESDTYDSDVEVLSLPEETKNNLNDEAMSE